MLDVACSSQPFNICVFSLAVYSAHFSRVIGACQSGNCAEANAALRRAGAGIDELDED